VPIIQGTLDLSSRKPADTILCVDSTMVMWLKVVLTDSRNTAGVGFSLLGAASYRWEPIVSPGCFSSFA
jgi:hypothetical protein